jgi:hypothetical protein
MRYHNVLKLDHTYIWAMIVIIHLGELRDGRHLVEADGMMDVDRVVRTLVAFGSASPAASAHALNPNTFSLIPDNHWPW